MYNKRIIMLLVSSSLYEKYILYISAKLCV